MLHPLTRLPFAPFLFFPFPSFTVPIYGSDWSRFTGRPVTVNLNPPATFLLRRPFFVTMFNRMPPRTHHNLLRCQIKHSIRSRAHAQRN
uniref:Putative secreted protein n=1 Tax=Anopheles darlingi TaxID=43151 RepID=A0A2M4D9M3_ANODA